MKRFRASIFWITALLLMSGMQQGCSTAQAAGQKPSLSDLLALGNGAYAVHDFPTARHYYQLVLWQCPHHPIANNNLAMVYLSEGKDLTLAEELAREALRDGGNFRPYILDTLAHIYTLEKRYADAQATRKEMPAVPRIELAASKETHNYP